MMAKSDYEAKLERRILHLETKVKHLTNDLWITREENESATASYLEIHSNMEKIIDARTKELTRAADKLRESEERYRFLVEESNDIIWTFDLSSMTYTYFSNSAERILGHPPELGRVVTLDDVFHPTMKKQVLSAFSKLLGADSDSTRILVEGEHRHKDGGTVWMEINALLHRDSFNQPVCFTGVSRDITDRKRAEEALLKSEKNYRELVENVNDILFTTDENGIVTYISPQVKPAMGYDPSEIVGRPFTEFIHQEDLPHVLDRFQEIQKGLLRPFEYRLLAKSGNYHWVRSSTRPIYVQDLFTGLKGLFSDITEEKQLKEIRLHAHKMEAIGTLAGGIAHDYNNLLAIIMGNLSMAQEETEPHSAMAEHLHGIEQASHKTRDLTHQLMTLSHGGYPMKKPGSIASPLKEIPGQVQANNGIEYAFSIQDDLWPVEYDSNQMHYTINNVLINAVEAMPQGGTVTIQAENKVIENKDEEFPLLLDGGKYVRISIRDEGRGIPEEHLNQIFDPYFSTKERGVQKGMGLGLTTAYAVVQRHGGHIMVNSTTGLGTTVTIYLPAMGNAECGMRSAECDSAPAERKSTTLSEDKSEIQNPKSKIARVLVMDDEESLRNLAQKMLERLGHKVETVKDGAEAIETYKKHMDSGEPFDGVILDLTIKGGMGGVQAIKELIKIDPDVKAIVCSGYFNDPVLANYEEHGFRGAMAKPYQKSDLESVLKKVQG